ncbi:carbohydrate ABC transporter permease [Candidatus Hakubella thermalkaliphila]|uniref:Multiple sugar transport system permease protein n=1 Tax=Candidatus Hakubella thermalkaliphila TaxID=2754717 RepID=A0A6V8P3N1_9ACTN|nr:carbohydrate ABC transporter permease [Candidatus Hakubella thermalkaliphila]GFP27195.1 multiple sugar transport system permease protein [Candidatus Hakubella thermalkaliphila]
MWNEISRFTEKRITRVFLYALLIIIALITIGPFIWLVASSFKHAQDINTPVPTLLPVDKVTGKIYVPTLENYIQAIEYLHFMRMFLNSFFVTSIITFLNITFNSMAAFAFARIPFRGRNLIFYVMLASLMLPYPAVLVPTFYIVKVLGMLDSYQGLIAPNIASVAAMFLMRQFFRTIPREMDEAAQIDGCSYFGIYWRIILPMSTPILATSTIFTFIWPWNNYIWPLVVINSPQFYTIPLGLGLFVSGPADFKKHMMIAGAVLAVAPILIVFLIFQRHIVKGFVISGIKG